MYFLFQIKLQDLSIQQTHFLPFHNNNCHVMEKKLHHIRLLLQSKEELGFITSQNPSYYSIILFALDHKRHCLDILSQSACIQKHKIFAILDA